MALNNGQWMVKNHLYIRIWALWFSTLWLIFWCYCGTPFREPSFVAQTKTHSHSQKNYYTKYSKYIWDKIGLWVTSTQDLQKINLKNFNILYKRLIFLFNLKQHQNWRMCSRCFQRDRDRGDRGDPGHLGHPPGPPGPSLPGLPGLPCPGLADDL